MKPIHVAVVEDDVHFRKSLVWVLQAADGIECVAEYATGEAAVAGLPGCGPTSCSWT
jgi:DNA-binding NarL/FixJ family response regulator